MPDAPDPSPDRLSFRVLPRAGHGARLLVLLHGYGEPTEPLTDRLDALDPDRACTVVVPDAPFEHRGLAIWHRAMSTSSDIAARQYAQSLELLDDLLGRLEAETGLRADEAIVGGFSQGGGLGLGLLLAAGIEHRPAAGFGICSFPPAFEGFTVDRTAAAGRAGCLVSAHRDRFAPIELSRHGAAALRRAGLSMTCAELDTEHEVTDEAARFVGHWIAAVTRGHLPAAAPRPAAEPGGAVEVGDDAGFYEGLWSDTP